MAITKYRNLGAVGVISDIPHYDLPPNAFNEALNVRFRGTKIDSIQGWKNIFPVANNSAATPFTVIKRPLTETYFFGTEKYLYALNVGASQTTLKNVTPLQGSQTGTGIDYPPWDNMPAGSPKIMDLSIDPLLSPWDDLNDKWSATIVSDLIVFSSSKNKPMGQTKINDASSPFVVLPGWGVPKAQDWDLTDVENPVLKPGAKDYDWYTNRIATYKQFIIALGMREGHFDSTGSQTGYDELPNRIRWSDIAFEGALPTNWIEDSDQGNLGGFNDLVDAKSEILDGLQLRDSFIIYTGSETYIMQLTGGDTLFSFEKLFPDTGVMSPGCVAEFDGKHFVVGSNDVFVHDGSQKQSVIEGKIRDQLTEEISSVNYKATRVYTNPAKKEIWVCYPYTEVDGELANTWWCNRAAIWNWEFQTWTFANLPRVYDMAVGAVLPSAEYQWSQFTGTEGVIPTSPPDDIWDGDTLNMEDRRWSPLINGLGNQYLYGASDDGCFYILDTGVDEETVKFPDPTDPKKFQVFHSGHTQYFKRDGADFDEAEGISYGIKQVKCLYPQTDGDIQLRISVGGNNSRTEPVKWDNLRFYDAGTAYKFDCRSTHRYHSFEFRAGADEPWSMAGFDVEYVRAGLR